jgi:hypothetical protein
MHLADKYKNAEICLLLFLVNLETIEHILIMESIEIY